MRHDRTAGVRLPVALTTNEARRSPARLDGVHALIAGLMCGSGLRVKDVEFSRREITVRDGKGGKDRRTMLPGSLVDPLRSQLERVRIFHERTPETGVGPV